MKLIKMFAYHQLHVAGCVAAWFKSLTVTLTDTAVYVFMIEHQLHYSSLIYLLA